MVSLMPTYWQEAAAPTSRGPTLPPAAGAVEIRLTSDVPNADRALCRILILPLGPAAAEPQVDRLRAAPSTHDDGSVDQWFHLGPSDEEEPTWEDAAWQ